ncbi:unnamed protein product [Blepharisma stoltei]|uniref:EF-hand domain-containing protein n=1 Tax=Blepharisma stoltei TaxID=1481888 RepID=A0AAU9JIC2_9CILI|nr:unnamed protein product [Blepharisma stoltei]
MNYLFSLLKSEPKDDESQQSPANPTSSKILDSATKRSSAKALINLNSKSYDTSKEGYVFDHPATKMQGIMKEISRPKSHISKRSRSVKQTFRTTDKISIEKQDNSQLLSTIETIEGKAKIEISTNRKHPLLRAIKNEYSKDEKAPSQTTTEKFFNNLAKSMDNLHKRAQSPDGATKPNYRPTFTNTSLENAFQRVHESDMGSWLKKRGISRLDENLYQNFSSALYEQLDTKQRGQIEGEELIKALLMLGIASDPEVLRKTLCMILKKDTLKDTYVALDDFKSLFRSNIYTDRILEILNSLALSERNKVKDNDKLDLGENCDEFSFFRSKTFVLSFLNKISKGTDIKIKQKLDLNITINEHQRLLEKWWAEIDPKKTNKINIQNVAKKLIVLNIAEDVNVGIKLIRKNSGADTTVSFEQFQRIFAKSMLKGSFIKLAQRLIDGNFACKEMSPLFKLTSYQRSLIMSGIKCPNSEISVKEGTNALQAIEKYKNSEEGEHKLTNEEIQENMIQLIRSFYQNQYKNKTTNSKFKIPKTPNESKRRVNLQTTEGQEFINKLTSTQYNDRYETNEESFSLYEESDNSPKKDTIRSPWHKSVYDNNEWTHRIIRLAKTPEATNRYDTMTAKSYSNSPGRKKLLVGESPRVSQPNKKIFDANFVINKYMKLDGKDASKSPKTPKASTFKSNITKNRFLTRIQNLRNLKIKDETTSDLLSTYQNLVSYIPTTDSNFNKLK